MSECDEIRELLSLAVAGALDADSERHVVRHTDQCAACAAELENWRHLARGLRQLPTPRPDAGVVEMARARAELAFTTEAERRWNRGVLILVIGLAWTIALASWPVVRFLIDCLRLWLPTSVPETWHVFAGITAAGWFAGVVAAVVLAWHQAQDGRLA